MRYLLLIFVITLLSCSSPEPGFQIYGTWGYCMRDGAYGELKIDETLTLLFIQGMQKNEIAIYNSRYSDNKLHLKEVNISMIDSIDVYDIEFIDNDTVIMTNKYGSVRAVRVSNFDNSRQWKESFSSLKSFNLRAEKWDCPDLRTDEERVVVEDKLHVDDSVEIDIASYK